MLGGGRCGHMVNYIHIRSMYKIDRRGRGGGCGGSKNRILGNNPFLCILSIFLCILTIFLCITCPFLCTKLLFCVLCPFSCVLCPFSCVLCSFSCVLCSFSCVICSFWRFMLFYVLCLHVFYYPFLCFNSFFLCFLFID